MWSRGRETEAPVGALSKSWFARLATVLAVGFAGLILGLVFGDVVSFSLLGLIAGVGCVVIGESAMGHGSVQASGENKHVLESY